MYKITIGLYDTDTDELVYPESAPEVILQKGLGGTISNYTFETPSAFSVPKGDYNLIIKYIRYDSSDNQISESEYSERIILLMNQSSTANITIPYFLDDTPQAPTNFVAGYKDPELFSENYYSVQFAWEDNSNIEQFFKFQLLCINGDSEISLPSSDSEWHSLNASYGSASALSGISVAHSEYLSSGNGTLTKNTTSLKLNIPLGKRYIARICACNSAGDSTWSYLQLPQNSTLPDDDYNCFPSGVNTINRFRVSYFLNNGVMSAKDSDNNDVSILPDLVLYGSHRNQDSENIKLLIPDGTTLNDYKNQTNIKLSLTDYNLKTEIISGEWKYWTKDSFGSTDNNENTPYSNSVYSGYTNISLFAHYEGEENAPTLTGFELESSRISIAFLYNGNWTSQINSVDSLYEDSDGDSYITIADSQVEDYLLVQKSKVDTIFLTINDSSEIDYDDVKLTVEKTGSLTPVLDSVSYSNSMKNWELALSGDNWEKGFYTLEFSAIKNSQPNRSFTYCSILYIKD